MEIKYEVEEKLICAVCGQNLEMESHDAGSDIWGRPWLKIEVVPCATCMEKVREEKA